jgi:hypothetical protein
VAVYSQVRFPVLFRATRSSVLPDKDAVLRKLPNVGVADRRLTNLRSGGDTE